MGHIDLYGLIGPSCLFNESGSSMVLPKSVPVPGNPM